MTSLRSPPLRNDWAKLPMRTAMATFRRPTEDSLREGASAALEKLQAFARHLEPKCFETYPVALLDRMAKTDTKAYVPLTYGYCTYGLAFHDPRLGTGTVGGAGVGVCSRTRYPREAVAHAAWLTSPEIQRTLYVQSGVQPAQRAAWQDADAHRPDQRLLLRDDRQRRSGVCPAERPKLPPLSELRRGQAAPGRRRAGGAGRGSGRGRRRLAKRDVRHVSDPVGEAVVLAEGLAFPGGLPSSQTAVCGGLRSALAASSASRTGGLPSSISAGGRTAWPSTGQGACGSAIRSSALCSGTILEAG